MSEYFNTEGGELVSFVGSWRGTSLTLDNATKLAKRLHHFLGLDKRWAFCIRTQQDAVRELKNSVEPRGISVAINGVVGDNPHRKLDVGEFRGFVLSDAVAPIIFINGQDAKGAQLFTIIHELAHLAFAETGVVDPADPNGDSHGFGASMERFCDRAAAEFLVSSDLIGQEWREAVAATTDDYERVSRIVHNNKVTFMVVARQILDNGLLADELKRKDDVVSEWIANLVKKGEVTVIARPKETSDSYIEVCVWPQYCVRSHARPYKPEAISEFRETTRADAWLCAQALESGYAHRADHKTSESAYGGSPAWSPPTLGWAQPTGRALLLHHPRLPEGEALVDADNLGCAGPHGVKVCVSRRRSAGPSLRAARVQMFVILFRF